MRVKTKMTMRGKRGFVQKMLGLAVILACCTYCYAQGVSVTTDKDSYASSEKISVTVANSLPESIYSVAASSTPTFAISNFERRLSKWSWDAYRLTCSWPECDIDFDAPAEIPPGKSVTFVWEPRIYVDKKYKKPQPGSWRFTLIYQLRKKEYSKDWTWRTTKSNEFTIE